jgi:expansin (peptidoglycan-binding protein)
VPHIFVGFWPNLNSEQNFVKFLSIKLHENSSCVNLTDIRGQADIGADMYRLRGA